MKVTRSELEGTKLFKGWKTLKSLSLPEKIEFDEQYLPYLIKIIDEIEFSAYGNEDIEPYEPLEIINFSPFHTNTEIYPVIIGITGIFSIDGYWTKKNLAEVIEIRMRCLFILETAKLIEILGRPIDWMPEDYFGVLESSSFEIKPKLLELGALKEHLEKINPYNNLPKEIFTDEKIIVGKLELNFETCKLIYANKEIDINPETQPIKLLTILLRSKGLIKYKDLAKNLGINDFNDSRNISEISRSIQFLKRDLISNLKSLNINTDKLIRTIPKYGYIINKASLT